MKAIIENQCLELNVAAILLSYSWSHSLHPEWCWVQQIWACDPITLSLLKWKSDDTIFLLLLVQCSTKSELLMQGRQSSELSPLPAKPEQPSSTTSGYSSPQSLSESWESFSRLLQAATSNQSDGPWNKTYLPPVNTAGQRRISAAVDSQSKLTQRRKMLTVPSKQGKWCISHRSASQS